MFEWSEGGSGLFESGSGRSRFVGTEAIVVKGVVMGGRIASDLVFMA